MNILEKSLEKMIECFSFNNLKGNASKWHVLISPCQSVPANIRNNSISKDGIYL